MILSVIFSEQENISSLLKRGWKTRVRHLLEEGLPLALDMKETEGVRRMEVGVTFVNDEEIHKLNLSFRNKDKPTNVLSFESDTSAKTERLWLLGDIVISKDTLIREAEEQGRTVEYHLTHLIVHGFCHLLGYDHELGEKEADEMEALETHIMGKAGLPPPYEREQ